MISWQDDLGRITEKILELHDFRKRMIHKRNLLFLIFLLALPLLLPGSSFAQETLTITTYYPMPYASYKELTAYRMKIGTTYSGSGISVTDDNLIVEGTVGIGTTQVDEKLEVAGRVLLGQTTAPAGTTDRLYNVGGDLYWNGNTLSPSAPNQATDTLDTTTVSSSDVLVNGMTLTPGEGNYLVWFSSSIEGNSSSTYQYVSLYVGGVQIAHTERRLYTESSIRNTAVPIAFQAYITAVGPADAIEVCWRTTGGTATMYQRTLTVMKVP
ncbi:MAG: hypothetical protein AMJ95_03575 [Omnitrophica WOR_2 bacterium SM23_72]|nr:MAG: hypothetical protein AMJ95_03575 [Omnitrophica WOR_2 bacterium SM23_72]